MEAIRKLDRRLGVGSHGVVYEGYDAEKGCFVAVKEMPYSDNSEAAAILKEIRVMQNADHDNLVRYIGARRSEVGVQLIMEYVSGGSLEALLRRCGRVRESAARSYVRDVLQGLHYLHDTMHVCHRDIKPGNILLTTEGRCKLTDFGVAKTLTAGEQTYMQTTVGTPWYMAPEVINGGVESDEETTPQRSRSGSASTTWAEQDGAGYYNPLRGIALRTSQQQRGNNNESRVGHTGYTTSADIWSVGVTVYEMISGTRPFAAELRNPSAIMFRITQQAVHPPRLPSHVPASAALRDFLDLCFVYDKTLRPSAAELLSHQWLRPASCEAAGPAASPQRSVAPGEARKGMLLLDAVDLSASPAVHALHAPNSRSPTTRQAVRCEPARRVPPSTVPVVLSSPRKTPVDGFCTSDGHFVDL